ncbi:Hypothetical protein R9X50_00800800 [Acrodontium crateriforme]|uniref:BTB domain-containing protein n=1 Tax=Acrodontium crateriforme TaxID=150365 RepID=A0AAQ3MC89_9PEZI|nr:Hypothetical protein R9X50_00800800 [Acrodontium crateriforme]
MADMDRYSLKRGLADIFNTGKLADFTIVCGPERFKVHKLIISLQSQYFDTLCNSGRYRDGHTGVVTLTSILQSVDPDDYTSWDDPETIKHMVYYFYHTDYQIDKPNITQMSPSPRKSKRVKTSHARPTRRRILFEEEDDDDDDDDDEPEQSPLPSHDAVIHAKVFAAAVKYGVPGLKTLAALKFAKVVFEQWNDDNFAQIVQFVFSTTAADVKDLREIVIKALLDHTAILSQPDIKAVLAAHADLMYSLILATTSSPKPSSPKSWFQDSPFDDRSSTCSCRYPECMTCLRQY